MRWTPQRKLEVVRQYAEATHADSTLFMRLLALECIAEENDVPPQELADWVYETRKHGLDGLCVTKRTR